MGVRGLVEKEKKRSRSSGADLNFHKREVGKACLRAAVPGSPVTNPISHTAVMHQDCLYCSQGKTHRAAVGGKDSLSFGSITFCFFRKPLSSGPARPAATAVQRPVGASGNTADDLDRADVCAPGVQQLLGRLAKKRQGPVIIIP